MEERSWRSRSIRQSRALIPGCGLSIHGDAADQQTGKNVMSVIIGEDDHSTAGRRDSHVIHRGHAQLPAVSPMNREWNKRHCANQFSNVISHMRTTLLVRWWVKCKAGAPSPTGHFGFFTVAPSLAT